VIHGKAGYSLTGDVSHSIIFLWKTHREGMLVERPAAYFACRRHR
jgi:hypothetical protein